MTILEGAYAVLAKAGEPLHYPEIAERMLADGWQTRGKTPAGSVNATISEDIAKCGDESRFVRARRGYYGLNPGAPDPTTAAAAPAAADPGPVQPGRASAGGRLSFLDAAERILGESAGREPMHYRVITQHALDQGLIRTEGRTPALTMYGAVYQDIRRRENRGEAPRFLRHRGGLIGLAAPVPVEFADSIRERNAEVRCALLERVRAAQWTAFEERVGELLGAMGFKGVEVTQPVRDGGIDVLATLVVEDAIPIPHGGAGETLEDEEGWVR